MSDSEEDRIPNVVNAPRQKRFRFKTFAERISDVEVDVYKHLGLVKAEPSSGSWLADGLVHWRELNSASHFLQVASKLSPLCQSLPQLLHHRDAVAHALLSSLQPAARLSLPALLDLLSRLARDLQQHFLPLLPEAVHSIVALLDGGVEREPESLEAIFTCVSHICKYLVRHLVVDLPSALRATAPLRYHPIDHVRQFAAQAVGFLIRAAPTASALRTGVRAVLAEQAARPTSARTDGAGLVLAEAVLGVSHGLHSRASQVLQLLLQEDLLQTADLRSAAVSTASTATINPAALVAEENEAVAVAQQPPPVSKEQLRARATAVARVSLDRLLDHLRRGKAEALWTALLSETNERLRAFERSGDGLSADAAAAARSLGRALLLLAQAVGYFRGSRVDSYAPFFDLLGRVMQPAVWLPSTVMTASAICSPVSSTDVSPVQSPRATTAAATSTNMSCGGEATEVDGELLDVSLSNSVLELVRCVVYGHLKTVGASGGPMALSRYAASWAPCFSRPPAAQALLFVKSLMVQPAGVPIATIFAPQMLGCLGRILMYPARQKGEAGLELQDRWQQDEEKKRRDEAGAALLLLLDLSELLQPRGTGRPAGRLPLLMTAQPYGMRLAAHVRGLATGWVLEAMSDSRVIAEAWVALSLLPHACDSDMQAVSICEQVIEMASAALLKVDVGSRDTKPQRNRQRGDGSAVASVASGLLLLRATATELLADLLQQQQRSVLTASLVKAAEATIQWLIHRMSTASTATSGFQDVLTRGTAEEQGAAAAAVAATVAAADYPSIRAAGLLLSAARANLDAGNDGGAMGSGAIMEMARELLSEERLRQVMPLLVPLLAAESQSLRAAVLRLLCCFDQPALGTVGPDITNPTAALAVGNAKKKGVQQQLVQQQREGQVMGFEKGAGGGSTAPRCDLLEVLYGINSQPCTIESGRKWAVAIGRLKTYLEYNRIPDFLLPSLAYGMAGVLCIRFSPLWEPASQVLAACIEFQSQVSWPIVLGFLETSQAHLLNGDFRPDARGGSNGAATAGGRRAGGGRGPRRSHAAMAGLPLAKELPPSQDSSLVESLQERYDTAVSASTPQATRGMTDPQNRLSQVLRAMAAAPYSMIEKYSRDWVPLFLSYSAVRGSHFDDGEGDVEVDVEAARAGGPAAASATAGTGFDSMKGLKQRRASERNTLTLEEATTTSMLEENGEEERSKEERRVSHTAAGCSSETVAAVAAIGRKKRLPPKGKNVAVASETLERPPPPAAVEAAGIACPIVTSCGDGSGASLLSRIGGKTWRAGLLDWLKVLAGLRGVRGLFGREQLQMAVTTHLLEVDSAVQVTALRCLRPFKFRWLSPEIADRLGRLADDATLREELATFPVAIGADGGVGEEARPGLIPLLVRVLFPKMRKRSGRLGGRGACGSARAAILNFLAGLRPEELRPLLELLLEPMAAAFSPPSCQDMAAATLRTGGSAAEVAAVEVDRFRLLPAPWWSAPMLGRGVGWWLAAVDQAAIDALPARQKVGFLNTFEDLLSHLGHSVEPFLPILLAITLRLLTTATAAITTTSAAAGGGVGVPDDDDMAAGDAVVAVSSLLREGNKLEGTAAALLGNGLEDPQDEDAAAEKSSDEEAGDDDDVDNDRHQEVRAEECGGEGGGNGQLVTPANKQGHHPNQNGMSGGKDGDIANSEDEGGKAVDAMAVEIEEAVEAELPSQERHREIRSMALRLLAQVWLRFPASTSTDYNELWGVFLPSVQPMLPRLRLEAVSNKEPPLLECVLSLSLSPGLARVLGNLPSVPDTTLSLVRPASTIGTAAVEIIAASRGDAAESGVSSDAALEKDGDYIIDDSDGLEGGGDEDDPRVAKAEWQTQGMGSALISGVVAMLSAGRSTEIVRATVLDVLDAVLGCGERLLRRVLLPWLPDVLKALHSVISQSWQQSGGSGSSGRGKGRRRSPTSVRELVILERLGSFVTDSELAGSLADSLVALLSQAGAQSLRRRSSGNAGRLDEGVITRALAALATLWRRLRPGHLPQEAVETYCEAISTWAIRLTGRQARAQLAAAYGAVARLVPRMATPALLLTELTAWSPTSLDDVDYDRRLVAYGSLTTTGWSDMDRLQALPLVLTALYDLRNGADLALRQAAGAALGNLVTAVAATSNAGGAADVVLDPPQSLIRLTGRVLYPQIRSQLGSPSLAVRQEHLLLLRTMVVALPARFLELTALLSDDLETDFFHNVAHLQSHRRTRALNKLTKLLESQMAAATGVPRAVETATPTQACLSRTLMDVIVPLLQQIIEEASGGSGDMRAHAKKQTDLDKEANVADAAVKSLGAVAAALQWSQYEQLLNHFIRLMRARPAKPLIRAVCSVIDNFHFPLPKSAPESGTAMTMAGPNKIRVAADAVEGDGGQHGVKEVVCDAAAEAAAVQRTLMCRVLPALHEKLVERKRNGDEEAASVRAPVALALVKLLKLLPPAAERAELPRALQSVANLLRARAQSIRDNARAVLVSMMAELGPSYLPYACHVLRASLPDRGYTAHVLGYTLHAVLEAVVKVAHGESAAAAAAAALAEPTDGGDATAVHTGYDIDDDNDEKLVDAGAIAEGGENEEEQGCVVLDESLELCLPMIEADLFGEVAEAKEVTAFATQYKEAKRCRANEAYQLLASGITFSTHMRMLLSTVTDRLHLAGQPAVRAKLSQLLQFAVRGVRANPTAGPKQIMALVVGIMEGCLTREEMARAKAKAAAGPAVSTAAALSPTPAAVAASAAAAAAGATGDPLAERAALHETMVLEFCLLLLHSGIKRGALSGRSPKLLTLLDPALPLLVRSLRSRHAGCVSLALRILAHIVPLPLPSLMTAAPAAGAALTVLLKKVPNVRHPIAQECFRLLAALLRDCTAYKPATAHIRYLLRWAFEDLGDAGAQPTSFALLRALLSRRVVVPEVYDVMERVQQIMVRSQAAPVRAACSVALLQFLMDFPLGPVRLRQHLSFLLANLEYEYESGRLQVLDMLTQVVSKFPPEILQAQADVILMPLVVRLVSDSSPKVRAAAGDVLRSLLTRLEAAQLDKAVSYCRAWLERGVTDGGRGRDSAQDAALRRAAAQTLGFVVEVEGGKFGRRLADIFPVVLRILKQQIARGVECDDGVTRHHDDESADSEAACPGWQEAYYCLLLLEKVVARAGTAMAWPVDQSPDPTHESSLVPPLWEAIVRLLLHRHMWVRKAAARLIGYGLAAMRVSGGLLASVPDRAGQLALMFFLQLKCDEADEAMCLQAVKCLVSLSVHLHHESCHASQQNGEEGTGKNLNCLPSIADRRKRLRVGCDTADSGGGDSGARKRNGAVSGHSKDGSDAVDVSDDDEDDVDEAEGKEHQGLEGDGSEDAGGQEEDENGAGGDAEAVAVEEEDDVSMAAQDGQRAFTLRGLVRRMARLADDARWVRSRQRAAALRWIAAASSALGATAVIPHLPVLLWPLYRISESSAAAGAGSHSGVGGDPNGRVPEEVRDLAEEVMAHLRELVGSEHLLAAYNAAREHVRGQRAERKRRTAVRGMVDPAAAAAARLRHSARKAEGRKRKLDLLKRERSAKQMRQTSRRRGGGAGGDGGKRPRGR